MSLSKLLTAAVMLVAVVGASEAWAQRDAGAKIRGEYGTGFSSRARTSGRSYRYSGPVYTERQAPSATPDATARRAFSFAPETASPAPAVAAPLTRYDEPAPRYYSAPRQRRSSRVPTYLVAKDGSKALRRLTRPNPIAQGRLTCGNRRSGPLGAQNEARAVAIQLAG